MKTYTDPRIVFAKEEKENPLDIRQKYDHSTKALQILHGRDLSNYNAIVTGANTGIGELIVEYFLYTYLYNKTVVPWPHFEIEPNLVGSRLTTLSFLYMKTKMLVN